MDDSAPKPEAPQSADDYCRTCKGEGALSEPSDRPGVTVTARCWRCDGTGYGR